MAPDFGLRVIYRGEERGFFPLRKAPESVGRGLAGHADIKVDEPRASGGTHFLIEWDEAGDCHVLRERGHPNPIALNGAPVEGFSRTALRDRDEISLGESTFRLEAIAPGVVVPWPQVLPLQAGSGANPYQAPETEAPAPPPSRPSASFRWLRVFVCVIVLTLAPILIGVLSGLSMVAFLDSYGRDIAQASDNAAMLRRVAIAAVQYVLYLLFLRRVFYRRWLHVVVIFVAVEFLGAASEALIWGASMFDAVYPASVLRHAVVAGAALATAIRFWPAPSQRPR